MSHEVTNPPPPRPLIGRERLAGLCLVVFGLFALYASADLPFFTEGGGWIRPAAARVVGADHSSGNCAAGDLLARATGINRQLADPRHGSGAGRDLPLCADDPWF